MPSFLDVSDVFVRAIGDDAQNSFRPGVDPEKI